MRLIKKIIRPLYKFVSFKKSYVLDFESFKSSETNKNGLVFEIYKKESFSNLNLKNIQYSPYEVELSKQWFHEGKSLIIGTINGSDVIHCWVSQTEFDMGLNEFAKLPDKCIYVYKVFIDKDHRGLGLLKRLYEFIQSQYREDTKKCYIWIANKNIASIKAHLRVGFKSNKTIIALRIKSIKLSFFTDFSGSA